MSFVDWTASYTVNNTVLDQQHQNLFKIINDLHEAMFSKKGREFVLTTIRELVEYTRTHFADEERQMEAHAYPGLAEHKAAHQKLINTLTEIEQRFHQSKGTMGGDVIGFLISDWLLKHIINLDKKYAPYMKEKIG